MEDDGSMQAIKAVLRVAARHPSLLDEEAFDDLAAAFTPLLAGGRLTLMVPDGPKALRVYAISRGTPTGAALGFGQRVEGQEPNWSVLFKERRAVVCDDMRLGDAVERAAAGPFLSYVALPCRVSGQMPQAMRARLQGAREGERTAAVLAVSFTGAGEARRAPIEALQEAADLVAPAIERSVYLAREHRLAMILETSGDAMLAWDRAGRVTDANAAAAVLTGRPRGELIGTSIAELLDPLPRSAGGGFASTEGTRHSLLARTPAGLRRITVAATVTAVERDALVAAHVLLRDLSQVVRAEREAAARVARIHELEEQHRTLLDNAPLIIFRLDPGTLNLAYLNLHAERLLGVPTAEALATPGFLRSAHADGEGAAAFDAAVARAAEGARSLPYEARLSRREGDAIWVRGSAYPLLAKGGRVVAIEGVLADVSAEHAARTRLIQADRLSTLGTLAAGVAHEINNPAAFILLGLDLLDRSLSGRGVILDAGAAESARETLRELRESIRRIVDIARDLRLFASAPGPQGGRRIVVDVNRTVESALSLTRGQLLERAEIEQHLGDVPPVLMDDGRLGQVVVNLLVNAAQAIPRSYTEGNRVRVETRSDGQTVEIEVEDTGAGIPKEILPRIWQPFFTTKSPEVGTGLGLSISREIVEGAGGTLRVESPVTQGLSPRGARFVVSLPAAFKGDDAAGPASAPASASATPRARVLVVDDEPALGRVLAEELGRYHEVVVTLRAEAALGEIRRRHFDVVLCDLCMPGMSGEALYARVHEEAPELCEGFVFMTGVGFGADVERFLAVSGRPILEKPFAGSKALDCIARVMRRRALR